MDVSVIGCGRWGAFLAWYLQRAGHNVALYGRAQSAKMQQLHSAGGNGLLCLPREVKLTSDLQETLRPQVVLVSVASQALRQVMRELKEAGAQDKLFVLCMKGLELETGKRLSEIVAEEADGSCRSAVWLGPGHVQEFVLGRPNCMVIDAAREEDKEMLLEAFSSDLIRFYYGEDLLGNEIGAAAKNVVGIAAGLLDGFELGSLKGALMSRGTREFARLIAALGGNELSAYGLCHLGDYEATVFSPHSHNRRFGEAFARGEEYKELAEGYYTAAALLPLARRVGAELPITQAVYNILYEKTPPKQALNALFSRSIKSEFYTNL